LSTAKQPADLYQRIRINCEEKWFPGDWLPFDDAGLVQVRELLAIYGAAPAAPAVSAPEEQP
jgi:hypothetical protein